MDLKEEFEKEGNWLFRYRSYLPLIVLIAGMAVYLNTKNHPQKLFPLEAPYEIYHEFFCLFISLIGFFLRSYTVGYTPKNTSGRNTREGQVAEILNTSGMYSIVRHPLYLGNFFMWLGPAALTGNLWFIAGFCLLFWVYYERIMFAEEQFLLRKFGDHYIQWTRTVPAFIPKFSGFKKSNLSFSWKKILKQEKNGLAGIFLIFCIFDVSGELIVEGTDYNYFFVVCCILTLIMYWVLKYLKRQTNVLNESGR